MAVAATTELVQEPHAPKLTPYIPMNISGVPKDGYFVQKRLDLLVQARIKKQQITEVLLAEGTKIRYKVTNHLIYCASDVLSVLSYEMARAPFGIALSYRELADRMGRYCEKFVMVACRLLVILELLDPPRQLSGRNRSLTWKLPGRQKLIDALVAATTQDEPENCSGPQVDESSPSGKGMPKSSRATDDITCSGLAQDVPTNKDVSASTAKPSQPLPQPVAIRHTMPPDSNAHAASIEHICPPGMAYMLRPNGIYAACNYESNYDSEDSEKLDSNYGGSSFSLVWDTDAITWLISVLCPLDRAYMPHEPKVVYRQAEQIFAQAATWGGSLEETFKRVSRTLKYAYQEQPWFKAHRDTIPFCIGKRFASLYEDMVKKGWIPPDEADQVMEQFRQGARIGQLFRMAARFSIDLSQQSEQIIEQMATSLEAIREAEDQRAVADPSHIPSDLPYLQVFAAFNCAPQRHEDSRETAPPERADADFVPVLQQRHAAMTQQFFDVGTFLGHPRLKVWNDDGVYPEWVDAGPLAWREYGKDMPYFILCLIVRHLCHIHDLRFEEAAVTRAAPSSLPAAPSSIFADIQEAEPITENLEESPGMTCEEAEQVIAQMQRDQPYHKITYRTSANSGVVLAIRWCSNPNVESEWLEVHRPSEWPGVWEARAAQTWARFEARRLPLRSVLSGSARRR